MRENIRPFLASSYVVAALAVMFWLTSMTVQAQHISPSLKEKELEPFRHTPFGMYLTAQETYAAITTNPSIVFVDVRDPFELVYVGHPEPMDANIPLSLVSRRFNDKLGLYERDPNKNFVAEFDQFIKRSGFSKSHPIILACREGRRSSAAAKLLHDAGYTTVWHQVTGFLGKINPETGKRTVEQSWVNAGLPYRHTIKRGAEWRPLER